MRKVYPEESPMFAGIAAVLLFLAFLTEVGAELGLGVLGWSLLAGTSFAIHHAVAYPLPWRRGPG